ncbi:Imm61 family immunity protein [Mycobacterium sp. AT1]|uniref:Imm61 family immunity protein n=1 Tax=Mycobacterium sp. AT1 TaxID=1961706 RepID=UPI0009ADC7C3|nr:hypothetical protein B1790_12715 [Mycobacterium sp. AT1]
MAGYGFTPAGSSDAAIFWTNPGGEIRFYIRSDGEDSFTLSVAERSLPEQFELYATSLRTIERYLFGVFGASVRAKRGLARLKFAAGEEQLAPGYSIDEPDADGYVSLRNSEDLVAKARGRIGVAVLVKLSHLLSGSVQDLLATFEGPAGSPAR